MNKQLLPLTTNNGIDYENLTSWLLRHLSMPPPLVSPCLLLLCGTHTTSVRENMLITIKHTLITRIQRPRHSVRHSRY